MSKKTKTLSFDIGHSSIGWAVLSSEKKTTDNPFPTPSIEGCGSVIFPKDDCLASSRRTFRRMRRNIRSTRLRITRLKQLLAHLQVLTPAELETPGHPAPHVLAARALLTDSPTLSWLELWHVLRWYAHNRGYDGNSRWSRQENDDEGDTDKEKAALQLMKEHGIDQKTGSMAETICATLGIKPLEAKPTKDGLKGHKGLSSQMPYKNNNAAFPRNIVRNEVLAILQKHQDHLPKLNQDFIDTLIAPEGKKEQQAWSIIKVPAIKLPRRYFGGLLFGQLIPRFDNRIIAKCPISGGKVPNKASVKFLRYRWAMLIANIKADGKPLTSEQRKSVDLLMKEKGRLTPTELREHVEKITGTKKTNIKASFEIHPDSKDALELDPALSFYRKAFNKPTAKSTGINLYWAHLPEITQKRALGRWKKKRPVNLQWMLDQCDKEKHDSTALTAAIDKFFTKDQKKKKPTFLTRDHLLRKNFAPDSRKLSGRAPYSRQVMDKVVHFVLNTDRHPTEKRTDTLEAGPIYRSPEVLKSERERPIDDLTNNHLLRQRLSILSRLTDHLIENYANNHAAQITDIVVEVASDLQTYSGLTAKEMAGELTKRLSHFKDAVKYLEENAPDMKLTGSLIRKCRIAMDLDWHCPFTGEGPYDPYELSKLELEHIIPYADRPTNALDALVLTWPEVNRMKGKRTAYQFIKEDGGKAVPGSKRLSIMVLNNFGSHTDPKKGFVGKLKTAVKKNYPDDYRRQSARKKWLMVEHYEAKDHGFTQGALTQTSHLNRLAFRQLEKRFTPENANKPTARITSIPGQVTAETRKGWRLLHTLNVACPVCTDKNKTEIRKLTHLHHALDAATLALTHHYLPGTLPGQNENEKGKVWKALLDRNKTKEQINLLMRTGMFGKHYRKNRHGEHELDKNGNKKLDVHLEDKKFPADLKNQLATRLAEQRVVQHIPADQSGAALELNPWRVRHIDGESAVLTQWRTSGTGIKAMSTDIDKEQQTFSYTRKKAPQGTELATINDLISQCPDSTFTNQELNQLRRGILKIETEKTNKLVGLKPGKLKKNKSVLILNANYGLAIDPAPQIIPFLKVPARLAELKELNGGKSPRMLRNGMLIRISNHGDKDGIWRIFSCKVPAHLDIARADVVSMESKGERYWRQVSVVSLLKKNALEILSPPLTGINPED